MRCLAICGMLLTLSGICLATDDDGCRESGGSGKHPTVEFFFSCACHQGIPTPPVVVSIEPIAIAVSWPVLDETPPDEVVLEIEPPPVKRS